MNRSRRGLRVSGDLLALPMHASSEFRCIALSLLSAFFRAWTPSIAAKRTSQGQPCFPACSSAYVIPSLERFSLVFRFFSFSIWWIEALFRLSVWRSEASASRKRVGLSGSRALSAPGKEESALR